jgi:hypothetical protein
MSRQQGRGPCLSGQERHLLHCQTKETHAREPSVQVHTAHYDDCPGLMQSIVVRGMNMSGAFPFNQSVKLHILWTEL